jgi:hypothetical protein
MATDGKHDAAPFPRNPFAKTRLANDGTWPEEDCAGFARRTSERTALELGLRVEQRLPPGRHVLSWCLGAGEHGEPAEGGCRPRG